MSRRAFLGTIGLLAAPWAAEAQQSGRVIRLGQLGPGPSGCFNPLHPAELSLRQGLEDAGYVINRNMVIERRCFPRMEQLPEVAAELAGTRADIFVVWSAPAALVLKRADDHIPIVFIDASEVVRNGLVTSLAKPGGNATGLTSITRESPQNALSFSGRLSLKHDGSPCWKIQPARPAQARSKVLRLSPRRSASRCSAQSPLPSLISTVPFRKWGLWLKATALIAAVRLGVLWFLLLLQWREALGLWAVPLMVVLLPEGFLLPRNQVWTLGSAVLASVLLAMGSGLWAGATLPVMSTVWRRREA